jgi:glycopeptide antibiotics resistance protein
MTFGMHVIIAGGPDMSLLPLAWGMLAAVMAILWFRIRNVWHLIFAAVFGVYLLFAIDAVFFPIRVFPGDGLSLRAILRSVNLVPFSYDFSFIPHMVWRQIFENILLTVPFGFGVSFAARLRPRDFLWLIPAVGIAIEVTQFILALLGVSRTIDIDDVILNGLGVLIGYLLFRLFAWVYVRVTHRVGLPRWGFFGYVYDVAIREDGSYGELPPNLIPQPPLSR